MSNNKLPFIDKKKSTSYKLVNRHQRDPLTGINEMPQNILVPINTYSKVTDKSIQMGLLDVNDQKDDYDYTKHLKPKETDEDKNNSYFISNKNFVNAQLPKELFASENQNAIGLMNKPNIPYEYDITLDGNIKEVVEAAFDDEYVEADCEDYFNDLLLDGNDEEMEQDEEEEDDNMTRYSMISASTMKRTEKLELLDDQFDKIEDLYNNNNAENKIDKSLNDVEEMFTEYLTKDNDRKEEMENTRYEKDKNKDEIYYLSKNFNNDINLVNSNDQNVDYDYVIDELYRKTNAEQWDCESILSTYSNIYNRPKELNMAKTKEKIKKINNETKYRNQIKEINKEYVKINTSINSSNNMYEKNKSEVKEMKKKLKLIKREKKQIRKNVTKANKKMTGHKKTVKLNKITL